MTATCILELAWAGSQETSQIITASNDYDVVIKLVQLREAKERMA